MAYCPHPTAIILPMRDAVLDTDVNKRSSRCKYAITHEMIILIATKASYQEILACFTHLSLLLRVLACYTQFIRRWRIVKKNDGWMMYCLA